MPLYSFAKFVAVPILSEWLKVEDFLSYDTALCSHVFRPSFIRQLNNFHEVFQKRLLSDLTVVVSSDFVSWMNHRGFSMASVEKCVLIPSHLNGLIGVDLSQLRSIESLHDNVRLNTLCLLFSKCSHLVKVCLSVCINDYVLLSLADHCPQLSECSLNIETTEQNTAFAYFCCKCTMLKRLSLTSVRDSTLKCILVHCRQLKFFSSTECNVHKCMSLFLMHFNGEAQLGVINKLVLLTQRERQRCLTRAALDVWNLPDIRPLCPNITDLNIDNVSVEPGYLSTSLKHMRHLRILSLNQPWTGPDVYIAVGKYCRGIEQLRVSCFGTVHSNVWNAFFRELKQLTHLRVNSVQPNENSADVLEHLQGHPSLTHLFITLNINCRDHAILASMVRGVSALRFNQSSILLNASLLKDLVKECYTTLTELFLFDCESLRDPGIVDMMKLCGDRLRVLHLVLCPKLTDNSLSAIIQYGRRLRYLNVGGCERYTLEGVATVARQMTRLRELTTSFSKEEVSRHASEDLMIHVYQPTFK